MKKINLNAVVLRTIETTDASGAVRLMPEPDSITVADALSLILRGMPRAAAPGQPAHGTSTGEVMDRMEIQGLITAAVKSGAGTLLLEDAHFANLKAWTEADEWAFSTPDLAACLGAILHAESVPVAELVKTEKAA